MGTPSPNIMNLIRDAQGRGLLDKLKPEEKLRLLQQAQSAMASERQEVLKPKAEIEAQPDQGGFVDWLLKPIKDVASNPVEAGAAVAQGLNQSINPLPLLNYINPFDAKLPEDVETFNSLFTFPVIRGAELAARMFVPEDQRPPLTTFAQLVKDQKEVTRQLNQVVPGFEVGTELGIGAVGLYELGANGLRLGKQLARSAPESVRGLAQKVSAFRAEKAAAKTRKLAQTLLREGDGPFLEAMVKRPERVGKLVEQSSDLTINDVAINLKDELETLATELGSRVGKFRDAAFADTSTRLKIPTDLSEKFAALEARTTFQGKSILPTNLQRTLAQSRQAIDLGITNPNQAMVWVDLLDDINDYGSSGERGSNAVKSAGSLLKTIRHDVKNMLRGKNVEWAAADDAYHGFLSSSDGLIRRLESDSAESLVANLFGKNKSPLRNRLESALNYAEAIDPVAKGHGAAFFDRLADIKAAEKIRGVQIQISDMTQDNVNRIVQRWTKRGERIGQAVGSATGGTAGFIGGGQGTTGGVIGIGGIQLGRSVGGSVGAEIGEFVGKRLADPLRVLRSAEKAKDLSKQAKAMAKDMEYLTKALGPEANMAFLDLTGPTPEVRELINFFRKGK